MAYEIASTNYVASVYDIASTQDIAQKKRFPFFAQKNEEEKNEKKTDPTSLAVVKIFSGYLVSYH